VIARGADGRTHFPAVVAGRIYRDLNGRFSATNTAVAMRHSNAKNSGAESQASQRKEKELAATDDDEVDDTDDDTTSTAATPITQTTNPSKTIWGDQRRPADKVKRVLMPIPARKETHR